RLSAPYSSVWLRCRPSSCARSEIPSNIDLPSNLSPVTQFGHDHPVTARKVANHPRRRKCPRPLDPIHYGSRLLGAYLQREEPARRQVRRRTIDDLVEDPEPTRTREEC